MSDPQRPQKGPQSTRNPYGYPESLAKLETLREALKRSEKAHREAEAEAERASAHEYDAARHAEMIGVVLIFALIVVLALLA